MQRPAQRVLRSVFQCVQTDRVHACDKPEDVVEEAIVGDERDAKAQGGSGHPSIGVVVPLAQCMADALAVDAVLGVDELGSGVDSLGFVDPCFEFECPGRPTASLQRP